MTDTTESTVHTLAAEVHVLKVGNRQITQSVAKQLDTAPTSEIEPFGRIRFTGDDPFVQTRIVGRRKDTGALVTGSHMPPAKYPLICFGFDVDSSIPVLVMESTPWSRREPLYATVRGRTVEFRRHEVHVRAVGQVVHIDDETGEETIDDREPGLHPGDNAEYVWQAFDECVRAHDQRVAEYEAIKALPLIVLAGLR